MSDAHSLRIADYPTVPDLAHFDLLNDVSRRRKELATEMNGSGDVSRLSISSLLDTLLILTFDEVCTQRENSSSFWGTDDDISRKMIISVSNHLRNDHGCGEQILGSAMGKGTMVAQGRFRARELWHQEGI